MLAVSEDPDPPVTNSLSICHVYSTEQLSYITELTLSVLRSRKQANMLTAGEDQDQPAHDASNSLSLYQVYSKETLVYHGTDSKCAASRKIQPRQI